MAPPACCFLVLVWVWWLPLKLVLAEDQQQGGEGCSASRCGNLTISQPFWTTDQQTGRSCGPMDFKVNCSNNTPALRSSGDFGFAILDIAYDEQSLRAVDLRKLDLVQASNSCHAPSWNTADKLPPPPPFKVDPGNLNLVLYDCDEAAAAVARQKGGLVETRLRCGNESEVFVRTGGYYGETSGYPIDGCHACVVPVLAPPSGEANARDYEQLIGNGFLIRWDHRSPPPRKLARQIIFCLHQTER
ncbi:hypothetical protein ACQ4PT_049772 [Festuca glaucescens]